MANFLKQGPATPRQMAEQRYGNSRTNLLLVVAFTAINLVLLVTNSDTYFLFSAFIPYFVASLGMLLCGHYPPEYYTGDLEGMLFLDNSFFLLMMAVSVVLIALYLLAWFLSSKNRGGWLIFALVFFGLDTVAMFVINGFSSEIIVDIVFHVWVLYSLVLGVISYGKLKKLPPEPVVESISYTVEGESASQPAEASNTSALRMADPEAKHRVLLQKQVLTYNVCYRRVKRTNELVINGAVYDEMEALVEAPHTLTAQLDGHTITAGNDGFNSFITVDGEKVAKKLRLF